VHAAVVAAVRAAQVPRSQARVHVTRFAADGACLFVTLLRDGVPDDNEALRLAVEDAAAHAGAWRVGELDPSWQPYLAALRDALDPDQVLAPDVLPPAG